MLLGWVALKNMDEGGSVGDALSGVALVLAMFACVVLHEFGHALTARRFGIRTRDITLYPIGGVAKLERMPSDPKQELMVALAGPAVNLVIAGVLLGVAVASESVASLRQVSAGHTSWIMEMLALNLFLALFNLIPAFPMDGGRVVRALLAMRLPYTRATQIAANLGQGIAILFALAGFLGYTTLVFIALFVWMGAAGEATAVQIQHSVDGIPVRDAMVTEFRVLSPGDSLGRTTQVLLAGSQHDFPVVLGDEVIGILTRSALMTALANSDTSTYVSEVMTRDFVTVDPDEMLASVFARITDRRHQILPVVQSGRLVGLLTTDNLGEFLMVQSALSRK